MSDQPEIIRNADGSINIGFYMARGRELRSEEAHKQMNAVGTARRSVFSAFGAWLAAKFTTTATRAAA